jgi:N-acetylneuraminic acid mutarotase
MSPRKTGIVLILFLGFVSLTCNDSDVEVADRDYPSIDTSPVTEINESGATLNGQILSLGTSVVIDHGFAYDDLPNPVIGMSDVISLGQPRDKGPFSAFVNRNLVEDRRYYVKAFATTAEQVVYGEIFEFISQGGVVPEVTQISPMQGVIGDTVVIMGSGFSNTKGNNTIRFKDVLAQIISATSDSIRCTIPDLTAVGENQVVVEVGQVIGKSSAKFSLLPISIEHFSPKEATFGDTVVFLGSNFPVRKELVQLTLFDKVMPLVSVSTGRMSAIMSNNVVIPKSLITVRVGVQLITVSDSIKLLAPVITDVSPTKVTKNTDVTIRGRGFNPLPVNNVVQSFGRQLTVLEASLSKLKIRIPGGIVPASYPLSVTVAMQQVTAPITLEVIRPIIASISPSNGAWGDVITISGENFGQHPGDNVVKFVNVQAVVVNASPTELKVIVPNDIFLPSSDVSVQVITVDNLSAIAPTQFVLDASDVFAFTPDQGKGGSTITFAGKNFNPVPGNNKVMFGDFRAEVLTSSRDQLTVRLPASVADGNVEISVQFGSGQYVTVGSPFHLISPWRRIADYPGTARSRAVAFTLRGHGYVVLGNEVITGFPPPPKEMWRYSPGINEWTEAAQFTAYLGLSLGSFTNQIAFTVSDTAYVGLGATGSLYTGDMRKYSPNGDWLKMPGPGTWAPDGAVAFEIAGKGYAVAGRTTELGASPWFWEYEPATGRWMRKPDFPGSQRFEATGFVAGTTAYLIGGKCESCQSLLDDVWKYDGSSSQWTRLGDFPGTKRFASTAFSINGEGYLIGGQINSGTPSDDDFWKYSVETDTWTQLPDFPGPKRSQAVVFVIDGKAYYGTGGGQVYYKDFWEFDPSKL